jgi:hypothetical protein
MSVTLAALVARLTMSVPALNGVPSTAQYEQCVKDAVADYGERRPNQKVATISVVSGTASYALPADFVRAIQFRSLSAGGGVMITSTGIIPMDSSLDEIYTFAGGYLTIAPTPSYTASRDLWYAAGHLLNVSNAYPDLADGDARILLLKAQQLALDLQGNVASQSGWKYQIGDEMVDKSGLAAKQRDQANYLQKQYEDAILKASGSAYGVRAFR